MMIYHVTYWDVCCFQDACKCVASIPEGGLDMVLNILQTICCIFLLLHKSNFVCIGKKSLQIHQTRGCSKIDWWLVKFSFCNCETQDKVLDLLQAKCQFSKSHFANFKPLICYHASQNPHQYHSAQDYENFCHLCLCCS